MRHLPLPNTRRAGHSILSILAAATLLILPATAPAQPQTPPTVPASAAEDNWLYAGSDIPRDLAWQLGELPNGLRYAVRNNGVPPGQVSIRVRMDVGSMFETETERGLDRKSTRLNSSH